MLSEALPTIKVEKRPVSMSDGVSDKGGVRPPEIRALVLSLVEMVGKSLDFSKSSHWAMSLPIRLRG